MDITESFRLLDQSGEVNKYLKSRGFQLFETLKDRINIDYDCITT